MMIVRGLGFRERVKNGTLKPPLASLLLDYYCFSFLSAAAAADRQRTPPNYYILLPNYVLACLPIYLPTNKPYIHLTQPGILRESAAVSQLVG
jgi:hypothetical protein